MPSVEDEVLIKVTKIETQLDGIRSLFDERLRTLEARIDYGDRTASQAVNILADTVKRLEQNQTDQGRKLRALEDDRLRKVEDAILRFKTIIAVAASLGGGSGAGIAIVLQHIFK